jgi:FKBP-type peptidyl-prolyl cis-trans isomerase
MNRSRTMLFAAGLLLAGCKSGCESGDEATRAADASDARAIATLRPILKQSPAPPDVGDIPPDAQRTPSGLASKVLVPGTGSDHPARTDKVTVHHTGWTKNGQMFDSSVVRGEPVTFRVDRVIRGWTEGLELMVVGEKRRFWVPAALAYGDRPDGAPGAEQGATPWGDLVFDIELLAIEPGPAPAPATSANGKDAGAPRK